MQNVDNRISLFLVSKALLGALTSVAEIAEVTGVEDRLAIVMSLERIMAKTMDNERMPFITSLVVDESGLPETHFWQALGLLQADLKAKQAFARAYQAKAIRFYRDLIPFNINDGLVGTDHAFIVGHQHTPAMNHFQGGRAMEDGDWLTMGRTIFWFGNSFCDYGEAEASSFTERCTSPLKVKQAIEGYVGSLEGKSVGTTESSKLEEEPASWEDIQRAMRFIGK